MIPTVKDQSDMTRSLIDEQGGLKNALAGAFELMGQRVLLSCTPDVEEEIHTIMTNIGLYMDERKPTDPRGNMFGMLPISISYRTDPIDPLYTPGGESEDLGKLMIVVNKAHHPDICEQLEAGGWELFKEIGFPLIGKIQSWKKKEE